MRRAIPFSLLALAILAATMPLWWHPAPFYVMDDGMGHLFRMLEFDRVVHEGVFYPRWAPDLAFGYGYPVFNFYAPLTDYLAESLHLLGLTLPDAIKVIFALAVLLAASAAYSLGAELFNDHKENRLIGSLVAATYVLFPYFLLDLYTRAAIAEALGAALLPWLIWIWRRLLYSQTVGSLLLAALCSAALVLTHNLTALVALPVLGVYLVYEWLHLPRNRRLRPIWMGALAAALGASLAAIYWLPLFAELSLVGMSRADKQLLVLVEENFLSLRDVIQFSWAYNYTGAPFPLALTPVLFGMLGALVVLVLARCRRERTTILFFSAVALVSVVLMIDWTKSIWLRLPLLRSIQFPWRLSVFVGLGVALAVGGLAASTVHSRWFEAVRIRSTRAADWIGFAFAAGLVSLCIWVSVSNLSLRRMNNLQGDVALPQLVRFEMDQRTIGLGTMNEYMPLTVQALPRRLNPAAPIPEPTIRLEEYNSLRRAFAVSSTQPISITLHAFYFPDWRVTIDGQSVTANPSTPMGLLTVDVPAGSHRVQVELVDTLPRRIGTILSGLGALIVVALSAWVVSRRQAEAFGVTLSLAAAIAVTAPVAVLAGSAQPPELQAIQAAVSPEMTLIGVQVENAQLSSDAWHVAGTRDSLRLGVYWQVKRSLQDKPSAWRLVDANGQTFVARELYPRYAGGMPATWVPNEIVPDYYDLPLDPNMPPGRYAVQVSLGNSREYSTVTSIELAQPSAPAPPAPAIQNKLFARLGDSIQFIGYALGAPLERGRGSPILLYWKADRPVPLDYTAFVQLIDSQGNLVAQHDSLTGDGFNTSTLWVPGRVVQDWHDLYVPRDVKPGLYRLIAGLYLYENLTRLPVADETGAVSPDDVIELGEIKIPLNGAAAQPSHALAISMGPSIGMLGYDLASVNERGETLSRGSNDSPARLTVQPNQALQLTLYWQARGAVGADYKVFVHVVDEQGQVVVQRDVLPGENQYPTRIWEKDEQVVDTHRLPAKGLPAGRYRIVVGMYDPQTGERLPAIDSLGNGLPDRAVPVGMIEVRNP